MTTNEALSWELCRSFLAVMREGNLSRAARTLGLTQPTLGRHVDEMERALGLALFTRSPQGLTPTGAAFDLQPHAQAMASAADALVRAASARPDEARGTVRITVPELIGGELMPEIMTKFHAKHPAIDIELVLTNVTQNLLQREADIGVRMVEPTQEALVARKIGDVRFGFYAHKSYLARHPALQVFADHTKHVLIGFDTWPPGIRALRATPVPISRDAFALRSDSPLAQFAFVRAGFGIGRGPDIIARRDPNLVEVLAQDAIIVPMWVAMHEDARASKRVRLVFDHLVTSLGALLAPVKRKGKRG